VTRAHVPRQATGAIHSGNTFCTLESAAKQIKPCSLYVTSTFVRTELTPKGLAADHVRPEEIAQLVAAGREPSLVYDRQVVRAVDSALSSRDANAFYFERLDIGFVSEVIFTLAVQHHLSAFSGLAQAKGTAFLEDAESYANKVCRGAAGRSDRTDKSVI
jgi:hypothetical protein